MKLEKILSVSFIRELKGILIAIGISFFIGILIIIITSRMPLKALSLFFLSPFSSRYNFCTVLTTMTPLIITGLAMSISFQAKVWNLAGEGQVYLGAFIGIIIGLQIPNCPSIIAVVCILAVGFIAGGILGLLPAVLRIRLGVNELITSYMVSLITIPVVNYFLAGPLKMPGAGINTTDYVNKAFTLPRLLPSCDLHLGFVIALVLVLVIFYFLYRTVTGYSLRILGYNQEFARYGGIQEARCIFVAMIFSGGLCGLAGITSSLGVFHGRMVEFSTYGYGWNGIAVALIARNNPFGVIPAAFLFAYLLTGANLSGLFADIPPEVAQVVSSVIYYLITAQALWRIFRFKPKMKVS